MNARLLFLGTGASMGVPVIGCGCSVCHSDSPFNKRLRPSVLICIDQQQLVIDPGPDFRQQALRCQLTHLDGVLLTHAHHDHTAGIDELRPFTFNSQKPLPLLLSAETAEEIKSRYYYLFKSEHHAEKFIPKIDLQLLPTTEGEVEFEGQLINYVTYRQGKMLVNGFQFGNLVYLSDIHTFSPSIFTHLRGVKTLIISALRYTPSVLHFSVDEAVDFANQLGAEEVWLTHISHDLEHDKTNAYLPSHVRLAYDGLEIDFWPHSSESEGENLLC